MLFLAKVHEEELDTIQVCPTLRRNFIAFLGSGNLWERMPTVVPRTSQAEWGALIQPHCAQTSGRRELSLPPASIPGFSWEDEQSAFVIVCTKGTDCVSMQTVLQLAKARSQQVYISQQTQTVLIALAAASPPQAGPGAAGTPHP